MAEEIKDEEKDKTIDIQAEVEKARKQERDKLHADIERLKAEVAEKAKTCNENYVTISNLQKELENHLPVLYFFELIPLLLKFHHPDVGQ